MSKIIPIKINHPLSGTWVTEEDDSAAEFTIAALADGFEVSGRDRMDGERFTIIDIHWDGTALRFKSIMPSTKHTVEHTFITLSDNEVIHKYVLTEKWVKI